MSIETLSDVPLYAARPSREVAPKRKAASWIAVGIVHLLILNLLLFSPTFINVTRHGGVQQETMLDLTGSRDSNRPDVKMVIPQAPVGVPPETNTAPMLPPPTPLIEQAPATPQGGQPKGDVLGDLGREIACSPGHYENLTEAQRTRCGRAPWEGAMTPNGTIVLNRPAETNRFAPPLPEYHISGQDAQRLQVERAQTDCPMMLNVPCVNKIPGLP
ncbi:MAG: hypothetical protein JO256_02340 [Alphaproteobacteria bacterium]|nr:hypothetical protein [Alphaproteobacteria bacterium]